MKSSAKSSITLPAEELRLVKALKAKLRLRTNVEVVRRGLRLLAEETDRAALKDAYRRASRAVRGGTLVEIVGDNLLRVAVPKGMAGNTADCEIMIDQSRATDNARLKRRLGTLPSPVLAEVKAKLRRLGEL